MTVNDRNGAAIRVGDPVLQRYPHRDKLNRDPFRGVVTALVAEPARERVVIEYREDGTEGIRNGTVETIEYDWHPPRRHHEEDR